MSALQRKLKSGFKTTDLVLLKQETDYTVIESAFRDPAVRRVILETCSNLTAKEIHFLKTFHSPISEPQKISDAYKENADAYTEIKQVSPPHKNSESWKKMMEQLEFDRELEALLETV